MTDPSLALQTLIGDLLAADPKITAHVDPVNIRSGSIRPDNLPAIVLAPARVAFLGHASGGHVVAEVRMILHIWAVEDGSAVAQALAGAAMLALMDAPRPDGFAVDDWQRPELVWMRDPAPERSYTHGTIALRAVLRWRAE
ncbi:tail completion protein gp17 [Pseudogemmobacter faecipullorum]|uniref:DUF3168 domain-containing protein n=1 Tax=Pseudogemmobacter faecipullorum TaxID=2755041 RepID=A0ABS8CID5_9RHOB|nr:DUF3168 domain-containing protein [Pseudogemmobacter faecipullorum]MCB5409157.1 DUF3168 domain-containing protein [Pseudogemmobacter faecipullorum]